MSNDMIYDIKNCVKRLEETQALKQGRLVSLYNSLIFKCSEVCFSFQYFRDCLVIRT